MLDLVGSNVQDAVSRMVIAFPVDNSRPIKSTNQGHSVMLSHLQTELKTNNYCAVPMSFPGIFDEIECQEIVSLGLRTQSHAAAFANSPQEETSRRVGKIAWLEKTDESSWIFARVAWFTLCVNSWYGFNLAGFESALQFTVYDKDDFVDWHIDCGTGIASNRKLSVTVPLNDSDCFDGGTLEFVPENSNQIRTQRGSATSFPSFLPHRVTRVTRGTRYSLVAWVVGNPFK